MRACTRCLAVFLAALLAVGAWHGGGAAEARRVKLNSIRTLILRGAREDLRGGAHRELPEPDRAAGARFNRTRPVSSLTSTAHPGGAVRLSKFYQCISDLECSEGSFCHAPSRHAYSRCQSCRRRKRRCQRDAMCCPGNHCSNNMCVPDMDSFLSQRLSEEDDRGAIKKSGGRKTSSMKQSTIKGQVGGACLRSSDCAEGLCCARHFWARICKPVLLEGQVCTRGSQRSRSKGGPYGGGGGGVAPPTGLELFQRCDCAAGLSCRALVIPPRGAADETTPEGVARGGHAPLSSKSSASGRLFAAPKLYASSSSSSSSLLAAASKSLKLASSSSAAALALAKASAGSRGGGSPPGGSPAAVVVAAATSRHGSAPQPSRAVAAKARLHLCHRN